MDCAIFNRTIMVPSLAYIRKYLPDIPASPAEHLLLLTIGGQEGGWTYSIQSNNGPAHSFWQFEIEGVGGVLVNSATAAMARALCSVEGIQPAQGAAWRYMATEQADHFSAGIARLLLWSDLHTLPAIDDVEGMQTYYIRNWRPGRRSDNEWRERFAAAQAALSEAPL